MPSRKGLEQALTWLKSKMAEKDTLDAINAEVAYNVIIDLRNRKRAIGALYHITKAQNKRLLGEKVSDDYENILDGWEKQGYTPVNLSEEEIRDIFPSPYRERADEP